jgi:hypothetical protein
MLGLAGLSGCAITVEDELGEQSAALTESEQVELEVQEAVEDAACYCEGYMIVPVRNATIPAPGTQTPLIAAMLTPAFIDPPSSGSGADARLKKYADAHRASGARVACGYKLSQQRWTFDPDHPGLSARSPHGAVPARAFDSAQQVNDERAKNPCESDKDTWDFDASGESPKET